MTRPLLPGREAGTAARRATDAGGGFLARMSILMGLSALQGDALLEPGAFRGFGGFLCRLQRSPDPASFAVRPAVLLPIAARDLTGPDIERLLALQQAMMMELGWVVGLSSEGLLQLSCTAWIDEPDAAVAALDLGQALGLDALDELVGAEAAQLLMDSARRA